MARVDQFDPYSPVRSVDAELGRQKKWKPKRPWGTGCAGIVALALVALLSAASVAVAKTGLVEIPVLTNAFYEAPKPVREVSTLLGYSSSDILSTLTARAQYSPVTGTIHTFVVEEEFSTLLSNALKEADGLPFEVRRFQVAVERKHMELFVIAATDARDVGVVIDVVPRVVGGQLDLEIERVQVGALQAPQFLVRSLLAIVDRFLVQSVNASLVEVGQLTKIQLEEGRFTLYLKPLQ